MRRWWREREREKTKIHTHKYIHKKEAVRDTRLREVETTKEKVIHSSMDEWINT